MKKLVTTFVLASVLLAACGGGTAAPSASDAPTAAASAATATPRGPKDQVKLPSVVSTELNLASLVAYAKDYFGEENIEVTDFVLGSSSTLRGDDREGRPLPAPPPPRRRACGSVHNELLPLRAASVRHTVRRRA